MSHLCDVCSSALTIISTYTRLGTTYFICEDCLKEGENER